MPECSAESAEVTTNAAGCRGRLFVLSGPSGVGKGTVVARLRRCLPQMWVSVSATTRSPRPGEIAGEHYVFVTDAEFDQLVASDNMLEWARYGTSRYGTPRAAVDQHLADGVDVLLEIDVQGARQVRQVLGGQAVLVFLAPPDPAELERRLRGRATESEQVVLARLQAARQEMAAEHEFDHRVVNDHLERATAELLSLIAGYRHSTNC